MKRPLGVQWLGNNMAELLAYIGQRRALINSFGDPVIEYAHHPSEVVELGNWVFRWNDEIYVVSDRAWNAVEILLMRVENLTAVAIFRAYRDNRAALERLRDGDGAA